MRSVVVGLDGGPAAARALEWAANAVGPHGAIHAVAALSPVTALVIDAATGDSVEYVRMLQRELETTWIEPVRDRVGTMTAHAHEGSAHDALSDEAVDRDADAIVVGAHVPARFTPTTMGSTTRRLLASLPTPLVVVPDGWREGAAAPGPVIVGVGHGVATDAAVRWAAGYAELHDLRLGLVRATTEQPVFEVDGLLDFAAYYIEPEQRRVWSEEDLAALATAAQAATATEIEISTSAVPGFPAARLVEAGAVASLLVIGQHRSWMTGSRRATQPLRHALTHSPCPVAVIPAELRT